LKNRIPGHSLNLTNTYPDFPLYQFTRQHQGERRSTKSAAVSSAKLGSQDEYETRTRFILELRVQMLCSLLVIDLRVKTLWLFS